MLQTFDEARRECLDAIEAARGIRDSLRRNPRALSAEQVAEVRGIICAKVRACRQAMRALRVNQTESKQSRSHEMTFAIGTALIDPYGNTGFVYDVKAPESETFTIGATMRKNLAELSIVWNSDTKGLSTLPDGIAAAMIDRAARSNIPAADPAELPDMVARAKGVDAKRIADANEARRSAADAFAAFKVEAAKRVPANAKAAIVATLVEDDSDIMSDYHGSKTRRSVILAWSTHVRDLFPEMRKAAAKFAETAHLATAPESAEHREKYSMGGGYYLKDGYRHSSGWKVAKVRLYGSVDSLPLAEFLPDEETAEAAEAPAAAATVGAIRIEEHTHTKKGFQMHICILESRVSRDDFDAMRDEASACGGWYSRKWGRTPAGFAFKDRAKAEAFAAKVTCAEPAAAPGEAAETAKPAATPAIADKLRNLADAMDSAIESKFADRLENTPKRARQAATARNEGRHLQRTQAALRALADRHESGDVPASLAKVRTKAQAAELMRPAMDHSGGYYDAGRDLGKPANDSEAARDLWALVDTAKDAERETAEELRRKVAALKFARIDGYFPTPAAIVLRMIEAAEIPRGPCAILEPSAGHGSIADEIMRAAPDAKLTLCEIAPALREVLTLKGYEIAAGDFGGFSFLPTFDRVLMNPPFEKGRDAAHVRHAFKALKPGGRLVAIMSPGPFFRQDKAATDFREWFASVNGTREELPAGAFKESGTGVASVLVTIDRES